MEINDVKHIGLLARLKLSDAEASALTIDLNKIVALVETLPATRRSSDDDEEEKNEEEDVVEESNERITRGDQTRQDFRITSDELIAASPDHNGRFIRVKKIIDKDA